MKRNIPTTAERWRRYQRDLQAYRRLSLWRRSHRRFHRDLKVLPHLFLARGCTYAAPLQNTAEEVFAALRDRAIWTLDTASRLTCGRGLIAARDLTGYLGHGDDLGWAADQGLIEEPKPAFLTLLPFVPRPRLLVVHLMGDPPPHFTLSSGDRVVRWDFLTRDVIGTLGWRPDLLNAIEDAYRWVEAEFGGNPKTSEE